MDYHRKISIKHEYLVCKIGPFISFNIAFTIYSQLSFGFSFQFCKEYSINAK